MQSIQQNNILIAEFMGWKPSVVEGKGGINLYYMPNDDRGEYNFYCKQVDSAVMNYNSEWNSLMPVVEKIETLGFVVTIEVGLCVIEYNIHSPYYYKQTYDSTKIKAVYYAVIEFIKWYNSLP